jgi:hypothetical protein
MSRGSLPLRLGLLIVAAGAAGCGNRAPTPYQYTAVGTRTSTGDFAATGGNLVAHWGKPGVMFGTVTTPKTPTRLSYVILFKPPPAIGGGGLGNNHKSQNLGKGGEVRNAYTINGKRVEAGVRFELNADGTAVEKETLTVDGKEVDPSAGRVFLLDLTAVPPASQQKNIALPGDVPLLDKEADVERYAEALLKSLQAKGPEIKDWLK